MKKLITSLAVGALLVASIPSTALAAAPNNYAACTVDLCNMSGVHQHDGVSYAGHTLNDGHTYHQVCAVSNCTITDSHDHNGETYFAHHNNDGHTYHNEQHNNNGGRHNRHSGGRHHS